MSATSIAADLFEVPRGFTKRQPWQLGEIRTKIATAMYRELRKSEDSLETQTEEVFAHLYRKFLSGMAKAPKVQASSAYLKRSSEGSPREMSSESKPPPA
jgi:hypothetical protein